MRRDVVASAAVLCAGCVLVGGLLVFLEAGGVLGGVDRSPASEAGPVESRPELLEGGAAVELQTEPEPAARARTVPASLPTSTVVEELAALEPGKVRVSGAVLLPGGLPARDAHVALFVRRGREPSGKALAEVTTDGGRAYVLTAEHVRDMLLVAFARGYEPEVRELALEVGEDTALEPIVLAEGAAISGSVRAGGRPMQRCEVVAILDRAAERFTLKGGTLVWLGGRVRWAFTTADTGADGSYRIGGLAPERYQVRISTMRGSATVLGLVEESLRETRAPAEAVNFEVDVASLRFRFLGTDGPVHGVQAELRSAQWMKSAVSDENGEVCFRAVPGIECQLTATLPSVYQRTSMALLAPAAGHEREEVIQLRAWHPPTKVRIEVLSATGEAIRDAHFLFYRTDVAADVLAFERSRSKRDGDEPPARAAVRPSAAAGTAAPTHEAGEKIARGLEALSEAARTLDGQFVLTDIPPGRYRVVVQAGAQLSEPATWGGARGLFQYCDAELPLIVPATGIIEQSVRVRPRGSLAISARSAAGVQLAASSTLRDARGSPVQHVLMVRGKNRWDVRARLDERAVTRLYSELCGGLCEVELACPGFRAQKVLVDLLVGEVTPLEVVLEPE